MSKCSDKMIEISIKRYDVSIFRDANYSGYICDIKYPCGEPIAGWFDLPSQRNAVYKAVCYINELPEYKGGHCTDEYCKQI